MNQRFSAFTHPTLPQEETRPPVPTPAPPDPGVVAARSLAVANARRDLGLARRQLEMAVEGAGRARADFDAAVARVADARSRAEAAAERMDVVAAIAAAADVRDGMLAASGAAEQLAGNERTRNAVAGRIDLANAIIASGGPLDRMAELQFAGRIRDGAGADGGFPPDAAALLAGAGLPPNTGDYSVPHAIGPHFIAFASVLRRILSLNELEARR